MVIEREVPEDGTGVSKLPAGKWEKAREMVKREEGWRRVSPFAVKPFTFSFRVVGASGGCELPLCLWYQKLSRLPYPYKFVILLLLERTCRRLHALHGTIRRFLSQLECFFFFPLFCLVVILLLLLLFFFWKSKEIFFSSLHLITWFISLKFYLIG